MIQDFVRNYQEVTRDYQGLGSSRNYQELLRILISELLGILGSETTCRWCCFSFPGCRGQRVPFGKYGMAEDVTCGLDACTARLERPLAGIAGGAQGFLCRAPLAPASNRTSELLIDVSCPLTGRFAIIRNQQDLVGIIWNSLKLLGINMNSQDSYGLHRITQDYYELLRISRNYQELPGSQLLGITRNHCRIMAETRQAQPTSQYSRAGANN